MVKIKFILKPRKIMGDYIAVHWKTPHLPKRLRPKEGEIWVREDWWKDPNKRKKVKTHEKVELNLMLKKGLKYKKAHEIANKFEENVRV
jgi:hypothetical protein